MTFKSHFVCFLYDYTVPFKSHVAKVKAYVQRTLCILGDLILFSPFQFTAISIGDMPINQHIKIISRFWKIHFLAEISTCRRNFDQNILPKIGILAIFEAIFVKICVFFRFWSQISCRNAFHVNPSHFRVQMHHMKASMTLQRLFWVNFEEFWTFSSFWS